MDVPQMGMAVPKAVRRQAGWILDELGVKPRIEQPAPLSWRVVLTGERVTASAEFRSNLGKCRYTGGSLIIDGKQRDPVGIEELRELWDKYETPAAGGGRPAVAAMPPASRPVPAEVRQLHDQLQAHLGSLTGILTGYADGRWIVGIDGPDGDGIRIFFRRTAHGRRWAIQGRLPIQVIAGGKDRSAEVQSDVSKAMAILEQASPATGSPAKPVKSPAPGARQNGVETRKMVVIRELPGRRTWILRSALRLTQPHSGVRQPDWTITGFSTGHCSA